MSDSTAYIETQFTEDAYAQTERLCQRRDCKDPHVQPGQPYLYVADMDQSKPGKYVCAACYQYYQNKLGTTVRRTQGRLPDPKAIRQAVSAAQSRATINPPPVVAMASHMTAPTAGPACLGDMAPPPAPRRGPKVDIPSALVRSLVPVPRSMPPGPASLPPGPASLPPGSGYGMQHLQYAAQRDHWARLAYRPPPAETISLEISVLYENGSKRKGARGTPLGSICEGLKDIPAGINAAELVVLASETMKPLIEDYKPRFAWRKDEFVVRDAKWVDLSRHPSSDPYFYADCLHPSTRKNTKGMVFKSKQFSLYVVIPERQWMEFQAFKEKLEHELSSDWDSTSKQGTRPKRLGHASAVTLNKSTPTVSPSATPSQSKGPTPSIPTAPFDRSIASSGVSQSEGPAPSPSTAQSGLFDQPGASDVLPLFTVTKRQHTQSSSISSLSGLSPPRKKQVSAAIIPNPIALKDALRSGGDTDLDLARVLKQRLEPIDLLIIPTCDIWELIYGNAAFNVDTAERFPGTIRLSHSRDGLVGVGAFKTCEVARLNLFPLRPAGLGLKVNQEIVVKRPYDGEQGPPYSRLSFADESTKLFREANILYWAKALLNATYNYIHHHVSAAIDPPPFDIPHIRFVDAGLMYAYAERPNAPEGSRAPKRGAVSMTYLAEELIICEHTDDPDYAGFIKFIHNSSAVPRLRPGDIGYETAEFLAFTQHVQYKTTKGQAFISDYQGSTTVLTDPQILTHPEVNQQRPLFGDGNLEHGVAVFEDQHICNKFCKWPGFDLEPFGERSVQSDRSYQFEAPGVFEVRTENISFGGESFGPRITFPRARLSRIPYQPPNWLREALQANDAFSLQERKIPSIPAWVNQDTAYRSSVPHNCHTGFLTNRAIPSQHSLPSTSFTAAQIRFRKDDLRQAQIISQIDSKFIACVVGLGTFPGGEKDDETRQAATGATLILIDQHAADERVRVERFLKSICRGFLSHQEGSGGVETRQLAPPVPVLLTQHEASRLVELLEFQKAFESWGFRFFGLEEVQSRLDSEKELDDGYVQVFVSAVPDIVSEKLLSGKELQGLIQGYIGALESRELEPRESSTQQNVDDTSPDETQWIKALRWCPRQLLDLINSKACRGAIMFNDPLSIEQCERLVKQLSATVFPFQCAHGRPSLVPLMCLGGGRAEPGLKWEKVATL